MGTKDPRIDAYIAEAAPFARPILKHVRKIVHAGCPEAQETMKWRMPHFDYKGAFCGMAAFKAHCAFGFWKGSLILPQTEASTYSAGMGSFGRITSLADLPPDQVLIGYVRKAVELNDKGVKSPARATPRKKPAPLEVPPYFTDALKKNPKAAKVFAAFNYSQRKEYVEWLTEAKRDETRQRRLATSVEWLSEGKSRMWKYQPKRA